MNAGLHNTRTCVVGKNYYRAFRRFSFKLCPVVVTQKKHVRSQNFRKFSIFVQNIVFRIAIIFLHHITFFQDFFGDPTRSEKPKNGIKNCDFDFGWSKFCPKQSYRESKIQKSTFQSLDSDRSLGPLPVPWWVGRWFASSFERFRGLYRFSGAF